MADKTAAMDWLERLYGKPERSIALDSTVGNGTPAPAETPLPDEALNALTKSPAQQIATPPLAPKAAAMPPQMPMAAPGVDPIQAANANLASALKERDSRLDEVRNLNTADQLFDTVPLFAGAKLAPKAAMIGDLEKRANLPVEDLKAKNAIPGMVNDQEKAKGSIEDQKELNDLNSPITMAYRKAAGEILGDTIDPNVLARMTGAQIKATMGDELVASKYKAAQERRLDSQTDTQNGSLAEQIRHNLATEGIDRTKAELKANGANGMSQKVKDQTDVDFYKDVYKPFVTKGGQTAADNSVKQLENAINILNKTKTASGPLIGAARAITPDSMEPALMMGNAKNVESMIRNTVIDTLRATLGAQFTEKEGERIFSMAFDPSLPENINAQRATKVLSQIKAARDAQRSATDYWKQNGTIQGWDGPDPESLLNNEYLQYDGQGKKTRETTSVKKPEASTVDTSAAPAAKTEKPALAPNEVPRSTKDGKTAIFDASTKKFLRFE